MKVLCAFELVLQECEPRISFRLVRSGWGLCFSSFYSPSLRVWIPDLALNLKYKIENFTGLILEAANNIFLFFARANKMVGHGRTTLINLPLDRRTAAWLIVAQCDDSCVRWDVLFTMHISHEGLSAVSLVADIQKVSHSELSALAFSASCCSNGWLVILIGTLKMPDCIVYSGYNKEPFSHFLVEERGSPSRWARDGRLWALRGWISVSGVGGSMSAHREH